MSEPIDIKIKDTATPVLRRLASPELMQALADEMAVQNQLTLAHISTVRMRGNNGKPFDPSLHILGIRTGQLYKSLWATRPHIEGDTIASAIGSNLVYAGPNEFGATIHRQTKPGEVRLRTNANGELLRQPGRAGAMFARADHKRFKVIKYDGGKRFDINIPERAPVRTGIQDRADDIGEALSETIIKFGEGN